MKLLSTILLVFALFGGSGCISGTLVKQKAKDHTTWHWNEQTSEHHAETVPGQPAYYALLPLTIPADIVASPFYLYCYIAFMITGDGP
jgi:hypothetical protein